jgi:type IV secretion system protein VirB9
MKLSLACATGYMAIMLASSAVTALDVPVSGPNDARIRTIEFRPKEVTRIDVHHGVVTRIILEEGERIDVAVVGLSSDCTKETDEWCISAVQGSNQIFVRPRDNAQRNNMELRTDKRDYSFLFELSKPTVSRGKHVAPAVPFYRVVFDYPKPKPVVSNVPPEQLRAAAVQNLLNRVDASASRQVPLSVDPDFGMTPVQRLKSEGIQVRNSNYTKQVLAKGEDADPVMVFDDGRFTYFEFPGAREIPAVFAHGSDGEPTRVNWHMQGNFVVVQRTARKFTLRLGDAVVGIFNESYDATGIETPTNTVSPAVVREIKGAAQ